MTTAALLLHTPFLSLIYLVIAFSSQQIPGPVFSEPVLKVNPVGKAPSTAVMMLERLSGADTVETPNNSYVHINIFLYRYVHRYIDVIILCNHLKSICFTYIQIIEDFKSRTKNLIPQLCNVKELEHQPGAPLIKLEWCGMQCLGKYGRFCKPNDKVANWLDHSSQSSGKSVCWYNTYVGISD